MAGEFTIGDAGVVAQQGTQAVQTRAGFFAPSAQFSGLAPGGDFAAAAQQTDRTLTALSKIAQQSLAPYIKQEQAERYYDGMAQVIQGKSVADVEAQQPAFTKIFGPSTSVQGAQAMGVMSAINDAHAQFMTDMPSLREQSPDQVRQYLAKQAANVSTGDPSVDALAQTKLAESWGSMLQMHVKQHIAYQQEQMLVGQQNLSVSQGSALQATLQAGAGGPDGAGVDDATRQKLVDDTRASIARAPGQTIESWQKSVLGAFQENGARGNFEWMNVLQDSPEWNDLTSQQRAGLLLQREHYEQRAYQKSPALTAVYSDADQLRYALTQGGTGINSVEDLNARLDGINESARQAGGTQSLLIDNRARATYIKAWEAGNTRVQAAYQKAQAGLMDDMAQRNAVAGAFNAGNPSLIAGLPIKDNEATQAMEQVWHTLQQDPDALQNGVTKLALVSGDHKLVVPSLQTQLKSDMGSMFQNGGAISPRQAQSLKIANAMLHGPGGRQGLSNYVGGELAMQVEAFIDSGADPNDPKSLDAERQIILKGGNAAVRPEDTQAAKSAVSSQAPGIIKQLIPFVGGPGSLTNFNLSSDALDALSEQIAPQVARIKKAYPSMSDASAAQYALGEHIKNADIANGTIVPANPYVSGQKSLHQAIAETRIVADGKTLNLSQTAPVYQDAVKSVAERGLRDAAIARGADVKNLDIGEYTAVGGLQLGNGIVQFSYLPKKEGRVSGPPLTVVVRPQQVLDEIKAQLTKPKPKIEGGITDIPEAILNPVTP